MAETIRRYCGQLDLLTIKRRIIGQILLEEGRVRSELRLA
jgi:hypothetical protein